MRISEHTAIRTHSFVDSNEISISYYVLSEQYFK